MFQLSMFTPRSRRRMQGPAPRARHNIPRTQQMLHSAHTGSHPVPCHTPTHQQCAHPTNHKTPRGAGDNCPGIQFGIAKRMFDVAQCWNCVQRIDCVTCHTHPLTHKLPGLAPLLLPRLGAPAVAITASNMKQPNKQAHARHSCVMTPHDATTLHYTHSLTHRRWRQLRLGGDISCEMRKCGSLQR